MSTLNMNIGQRHMIFCAPSPVDEFYCEHCIDGDCEALRFSNPLYVLLNQKRLDKLGSMNLEEWLSSFSLQKSSSIDQLRQKCSDEDILATIKSRHLQSPAEILAWARKMNNDLNSFNEQVQEAVNAQQSEETVVETSNTD